LTESELCRALSALTKNADAWEANVPYVSSLLASDSVKVRAKALWLLGETGLKYPLSVAEHVCAIAAFRNSAEPLLRERAITALGRIGRGDISLIEPYWADLFRFADDEQPNVRLSFIWASENIAVHTPDVYAHFMPVFAKLLADEDDRVRMEAPEIFRVLGKRRPDFVRPYTERLRTVSETDGNRVVRLHCIGAIKAACPEQTTADGRSANRQI
jgi:HEAT repeat protein